MEIENLFNCYYILNVIEINPFKPQRSQRENAKNTKTLLSGYYHYRFF